ncbi:hypothetical protein [Psychrobacillus sp. FSL K6-1415]|uniref:hypothetical protein n=1 Tax=Psychrobacillus sp. FSL K6-1415 TaxID=2921544 RepID=UPI0030FB427B
MKIEKEISNDYTPKYFDQAEIETVNCDIKEWLRTENMVYKGFFEEVTREEEFKAVKEAMSDAMIER